MTENSVKTCRFCLYEENSEDEIKVLGIFDSEIQEDFAKKIISYTGVEVSPTDKIPPYICTKCVDCIEHFDKFLECCWKSEKTLREKYMPNQVDDNITSERSKSYLSNEHLYVFSSDYRVTYNRMYVTNFEYFSGSTSGMNVKFANSDETSTAKVEDTASDDSNEESDSDVSSGKEIKDNINKIMGDNTYVCSICSTEFKSFFEYQDHQDTHNGQLVFSCTKCDQVFTERKLLVEHDAKHKVACQVCNKMVLPKSLAAHLKKHTDIYRCTECHLTHTSKASLENHVRARHLDQKGLVCHICGKQSSCQSSLNRHLAYHSSARPYHCKHCNFSTKSSSVLKVHTSRKHLGVQISCEQCGKLFKSDVSLKQHKTRIHSLRKHICHICQKAFIEKHRLERHILRKHDRQRIYECNVCNTEFYTVRQLKDHMHSHKQGSVSCPNCGKRFFYKKYLEKHLVKCMPKSGDVSLKDKLCRLKSTISLPSSSMQLDKLKDYD